MKSLLGGVPGVQKESITVRRNPKDTLDNTVSASYDPGATNLAAMEKVIAANWDLTWYECACGKTSPVPAQCCGAMKKAR